VAVYIQIPTAILDPVWTVSLYDVMWCLKPTVFQELMKYKQ